jgi:hypothetical protein
MILSTKKNNGFLEKRKKEKTMVSYQIKKTKNIDSNIYRTSLKYFIV